MERLGYRPELDGLRGIAIALVVAYHYTTYPRGGFIGVDLFFVLSGFLITTLLIEERHRTGRISLSAFYARRLRRLTFPLLAFLVGFMVLALSGEVWWMAARMKALLYGLTYTTDIAVAAGQFDNGALAHTAGLWSLGVEEKFYLLWPALLLVLIHFRQHPVVVVLGLSVLVFAARWFAIDAGWSWTRVYFAPEFRADQLLIGCALGLTWRHLPKLKGIGWVGLALVAFFAVTLRTVAGSGVLFSASFTAIGLAAAALIFGALHSPSLQRVLSFRPLVALGLISYSLYLWHQLLRIVAGNPWLGITLSLLAASASYLLIERPMALRRSTSSPRRVKRPTQPDTNRWRGSSLA